MNFVEKFIVQNFRIIGSTGFISVRALEFLTDSKCPSQSSEISGVQYIEINMLNLRTRKLLGIDNSVNYYVRRLLQQKERNEKYEAYLAKELTDELKVNVRKYKDYSNDFLSYKLPADESDQKAITFCIVSILLYFLKTYKSERVLYEGFKDFDLKGEVECGTAREFCQYIKWIKRIGKFKGVLLGRKNAHKWSAA